VADESQMQADEPQMQAEEPLQLHARERPGQIRITENGPYRVRGTPLVRTAVLEDGFGDAIAWAQDEPVTTAGSYALCRCGGSSTKPFCDDSHLTNGFDGTEVADRGPREDRMRVFPGDGVEMTDDPSLCTHVGFCTNRRTHVWQLIGETEDEAVREQLLRMLDLCPSGRLGHRSAPDAAEDEPELGPSVAAVRDGPLWVRGGVEVVGADGVAYERRNRVALCRCGHSRNKPFCDGSHVDVGFRDPEAQRHAEEPEDREADPRPSSATPM
jgi:CDGSH-type Zn-finger protein